MNTVDKFTKAFYEKFDNSAAVILSESNRLYLTGFSSSDGAVFVTPSEKYLVVDFRYYEMARSKVKGFKVILAQRGILSEVKKISETENIKRLVFEDDYLTVSHDKAIKKLFDKFEILYFEDLLKLLRAEKTPEEIEKIKVSQRLTDEAFSHLLNLLSPNMTENDVASEIEYYFKKNGAETAFKTIAVSGANSSLPHGVPSDKKLALNSFLTLDFGAKLDGYASDMTRTVVIGKATPEMKEIYDIVLAAQLNALDAVKAGKTGSEIDAAARDLISLKGYGDCFGHSTGHGLGIDVHEYPSFSPKFDFSIPENSVMSVEPGIYIEGKFGVRIEDIVVVKREKCEILTLSDKNLIEIS